MKNSNIKITIKNPCNKINWTTMSDFERGKFCSICSKSVTDFTKMKDDEIINFLNRSDKSVCARLNQSQINRILTIEKTDKIKHWNKIVATIALMTISTANYSNTVKDKNFKTELNCKVLLDTKENIIAQSNTIDSLHKIIKGRVVENGLNYSTKTSVFVKGTKIKTVTDSLGNFELVIPKNYTKFEITLIVKSTGLEDDTEITLQSSDLPKYDLIITKNSMMIGEVIIIKRKRWWQFWI